MKTLLCKIGLHDTVIVHAGDITYQKGVREVIVVKGKVLRCTRCGKETSILTKDKKI